MYIKKNPYSRAVIKSGPSQATNKSSKILAYLNELVCREHPSLCGFSFARWKQWRELTRWKAAVHKQKFHLLDPCINHPSLCMIHQTLKKDRDSLQAHRWQFIKRRLIGINKLRGNAIFRFLSSNTSRRSLSWRKGKEKGKNEFH